MKKIGTELLAKRVAKKVHLPHDVVRTVLEAFREVLQDALSDDLHVIFKNFGTWRIKHVVRPMEGISVRFRINPEVKISIRKSIWGKQGKGPPFVEKYGVELNNEAVLLAKVTGLCPKCQSPLESKDPPKCPNCGTQPFEPPPVVKSSFPFGGKKNAETKEG